MLKDEDMNWIEKLYDERMEVSRQATAAYKAHEWDKAESLFNKAHELYIRMQNHTGPSRKRKVVRHA
jgi:hypothetical protein